jgi:hypothetical protein
LWITPERVLHPTEYITKTIWREKKTVLNPDKHLSPIQFYHCFKMSLLFLSRRCVASTSRVSSGVVNLKQLGRCSSTLASAANKTETAPTPTTKTTSWGKQKSFSTNTIKPPPPLSRQAAQELLDNNPIFRKAVMDFTTYRDIVEGQLGGGSTVDLVDKAIQFDYGLRLRSSLNQQKMKMMMTQQHVPQRPTCTNCDDDS